MNAPQQREVKDISKQLADPTQKSHHTRSMMPIIFFMRNTLLNGVMLSSCVLVDILLQF